MLTTPLGPHCYSRPTARVGKVGHLRIAPGSGNPEMHNTCGLACAFNVLCYMSVYAPLYDILLYWI